MTEPRLGRTPSQTVGPYLHIGLLGPIGAELVAPGTAGAIRVHGLVLDGAAERVPDALVETWQAGPSGRYGDGAFGRSDTRAGGRFELVTVKPGSVPWPEGGLQAPHLAVGVFARGLLKRLVTRMYFPDEEEANAADPVLAAIDPRDRGTLIAVVEPDGSLRFDIRLQGPGQTVFFAL
jgi:protocatechuate 3,4-dioxygenase, alpha subunit